MLEKGMGADLLLRTYAHVPVDRDSRNAAAGSILTWSACPQQQRTGEGQSTPPSLVHPLAFLKRLS